MNLQKMMKQAQEMQSKLAEVQARLETQETDGSSGGGMVKVRINGKSQLLAIDLDPSLLKAEEKEVLEDLIVAAFTDAKTKSDTNFADQMSALSSGLNLPPGFKFPF
jgi:DNA-binding YbaB/EbfC family protein